MPVADIQRARDVEALARDIFEATAAHHPWVTELPGRLERAAQLAHDAAEAFTSYGAKRCERSDHGEHLRA